MDNEADIIKKQLLLGRVYFLALIPFAGAVLIPWILGPKAGNYGPTFVLWSFTVLLFVSAVNLGYTLGQKQQWLYLQGFISLLLGGLGVGCVLLALEAGAPFASITGLTVLHWLSWLWMQKSRALSPAFFKQHNRFVWTTLGCHMLVLFNLIYVVRVS